MKKKLITAIKAISLLLIGIGLLIHGTWPNPDIPVGTLFLFLAALYYSDLKEVDE